MKSNRILLLVLLAIIVIFVAGAGYLYTTNNGEINKQTQLKNSIDTDQMTINKEVAQKADLETTAGDIANQLASAQAALADIHFRPDVQSIEYDRILYGIADTSNIRITNLSATPPTDMQEQNNKYQLTKFTVTVEGLSPEKIFNQPADDTAYLSGVVTNILAFTNNITNSPDFDTALIQSVDITEPDPMTASDVQAEIDSINNKIADSIKDQIAALATQIQTDNADTLTQDQINALIKTETDKLIADTLAAKTADEIKTMVDEAGIKRPSAVITINIWTYKGA